MTDLCSDWITGDDVAGCCEVDYGTDPSVFDAAAQMAQEILFQFSGRQFPGLCTSTVRPCSQWCRCPWQILSRGHIVWNPNTWGPWFGWYCGDDIPCGCMPIDRVILSGYAVSITEVLIDGVAVDPATYRLDDHRWLTRMRDPADPDTPLFWPNCQTLDLPETEPGTFAITYVHGRDVPLTGQAAAIELGCEIYKACANLGDCKLPKGVVRLARQGVVMEKTPFAMWGYEFGKRGRLQRGWQTGMAQVDVFLNAYNTSGIQRVPVIWSPAANLRFPLRTS
jgi:hypothetical protein